MKLRARMDANHEKTINEIRTQLASIVEASKKRSLTSNERTKAAKTTHPKKKKAKTTKKASKTAKAAKKIKTTKNVEVNGKCWLCCF